MSVFVVDLTRSAGVGTVADTSVDSNGLSLQKTIYVPGPNLVWRKLTDGETFTDSNYWKRFASVADGGTLPENAALLSIDSDDGTIFDDHNPGNNTFAVVEDLTVAVGTGFGLAANQIDVVGTHGGYAIFTQIVTDVDVTVRINGSSSADLDVSAGSQVFDNGDLQISSLAFSNLPSGGSDATVQVLMSIVLNSST